MSYKKAFILILARDARSTPHPILCGW